MTTLTAITAASFINTLGVNTHIDFNAYGYQNLSTVESALNYLGVRNVRDSGQNTSDLNTWLQVSQATGVKFDDYMPEGSPAAMQNALTLANQLANEGILNFLEGGNEEDDAYAASQGNTLVYTAQFQQQVYATGHSLGLPVINMSFGSGWTAANNWQGDYGAVGNLAAYADYGNAHTYPNAGQTPDSAIQQINALAPLAAAGRPVITTEIGWDNATFSQAAVAQYVVDAALDGIKDGDVKMYYYALFDDGSGQFGLMNQDGTPKPAGTALHDLTTLLADNGANAANFTPGSLSFTLSGNVATDNTLLIQKSDGSDWLALWDETAAAHNITLTLPVTASKILVFDPVTGTSSVAGVSNTNTISVTLKGDPLLVEIVPSTGSTGSSGGSTTPTGGTTTTGSNDLAVSVPATETATVGTTIGVSGVSVSDAWAAANPGSMALNVWDSTGTLTINGKVFAPGGGPVANGMFSGTLAQINADLATLSYTAGPNSGSDTITIDVWNQAGVEVKKTIAVTVNATPAPTQSSTATPNPVITLPASDVVTAGTTSAISGISVADPWAASSPGTLALNLSSSSGQISDAGQTGTTLHLSGTLTQINADLASLSYIAPGTAGSATVTVDVWDQAGVEATKSINVTINAPVTTINIAASDTNPVENVSNAVIIASSGNHMIFIGGTGDTVTATGGTETIQAYQGNNTITTGAGNDTLRFAGSNNVIDAGAGNNQLFDSGSNNRIILPGAGHGYDAIYGYTLTNGDTFDLRSLLGQTSWNGDPASLSKFLKVSVTNNNGVLKVDPSGTKGGALYTVATFESSGAMTLNTLLAHAIT